MCGCVWGVRVCVGVCIYMCEYIYVYIYVCTVDEGIVQVV